MIHDSLCLINQQLTTLPDTLPATLKTLDCTFNNLTSLPANFPTSLTYLSFQHNQITTMPCNLPPNLKYLYCGYNQITSLWTIGRQNKLPHGLTDFSFSGNKITVLPDYYLPASLEVLHGSNNQLTSLPDNLPDSLEYINIDNNPLQANYPKIFTFGSIQAKEIIAHVRECNSQRRTKERLAIINEGNVLLERYMRRMMHPSRLKALVDNPDIDVDEYMEAYVATL